MLFLAYARKRLRALLDQISRLYEAEFPYPHSREALQQIDRLFRDKLQILDSYDTSGVVADELSTRSIKQECINALRCCFDYLPLLGFLLRSTNVRNAFEAFGPLLRLGKDLLETDAEENQRATKLVISSEWDYSPLTYFTIPHLSGFVFIGLPAPESENPLLLPLAGHEFGHSLWARHNLDTKYRVALRKEIIQSIKNNWGDYQDAFHVTNEMDQSELTSNFIAIETWEAAVPWAVRQAQETFCDLVGVQLFGRAFLSAFAYLLSPNHSGQRCEFYPSMHMRIGNLLEAASRYGVDCPLDYAVLFEDDVSSNMTPADSFRLARADDAIKASLSGLIDSAQNLVRKTRVVVPSDGEITRIADQLRKVCPAEHSRSLADILNAAWRLSEEQELWKEEPQVFSKRDRILAELVLKNIELFEIEKRMEAVQG